MSSNSSNLYKVGRGGAGNYHSKSNADSVTAAGADHEPSTPQKQGASSSNTASAENTTKLAGRGGAGNIIESGSSDPSLVNALPSTLKQVTSSTASSQGGMISGRGGSGNWKDKSAEEAEKKKRELEARSKMEKQIRDDVELGLKMPEPAHWRQGKDTQ